MGIKEYSERKRALMRMLDDFFEVFRNFMHLPEIKRLVNHVIKVHNAAIWKIDEMYFGYMRLN